MSMSAQLKIYARTFYVEVIRLMIEKNNIFREIRPSKQLVYTFPAAVCAVVAPGYNQ